MLILILGGAASKVKVLDWQFVKMWP